MSHAPPTYSAVNFIVRHRITLAILVGLVPFAASLLAFFTGYPWWIIPLGVVASGFVYLIMKSYVEMMCLLSDMLIPK